MIIYKIDLRKQGLASLPSSERTLLFLLGHITNEINVLHKVMLAMRGADKTLREVVLVQDGQTLVILRLLIGKLHEGWELFKKRVQRDKYCRETYLPSLSSEAQESFRQLKRHFGKGSPLSDIRNKLAFHNYDEHELLEASFNAMPEIWPWHIYLGDHLANTFHYESESVVTHAVADLGGGLNQVFELALTVAWNQLQLFEELLIAIVEARLPRLVQEPMDIGPAMSLNDVKMPFFVQIPPIRSTEGK